MKKVWKEPDPIATVMKNTGMSRLQVLLGIRAAMLERHRNECERNPKAMQNLDAMIQQAKEALR